MLGGISRRSFLGGAVSAVAGVAIADAPLVARRPLPRATILSGAAPARARQIGPSVEALIAQARLGGEIGYVVADARTGVFLESRNSALSMPPASVAKAVTALYGLTTLGSDFRFHTRLLATGPVSDGVVQGDLVLAGTGDPQLDTDALADMARALRAGGVRGVSGRFLVHGGVLPYIPAIDPRQPEQVGYNPAISGLNLNYNRVHFEWKKAEAGWNLSMDARTASLRPAVTVARMSVVQRELPVYTYRGVQGIDEWTVASEALGNGGSRWLPVRRPDLYAGEVFKVVAAGFGVRLPGAEAVKELPGGDVLVRHESDTLSDISRAMLKYSTNLTAEVIGLTASARRGAGAQSLKASADTMSAWLRARCGARSARFVDHSGLSDRSRISAADMVAMLVKEGPGSALHAHFKEIAPRTMSGEIDQYAGHRIQAKTGTLNFVSSLSGFVTTDMGTSLAFTIFTGDVPRRARLAPEEMERPDGARAWANRSRWLQHQLINRWAGLYGV